MDFSTIQAYMGQYGLLFLFIVIFLEYLNLPGFPAGIILPVAGIWSASTNTNFWLAVVVSVISAVLASWMLYFVGLFGGEFLIGKFLKRFPKQEPIIEKSFGYIREKGCFGIFISKLIPVIRTIISIPAGVVKLNFIKYTVSSALGIFIWNFVLIASGYYLGDQVLIKLMS